MTKLWKYPDEITEYIKNNVKGRTTKQLTQALNELYGEKYGITFTEAKIKCYKANHGLKSGTNGGNYTSKYPDGMRAYIKSIAAGTPTSEIARKTEEHFGIEFPVEKCRAYMKNHGIKNGLDCRIKKGNVPPNKGKKLSPELYAKAAGTMFKKGHIPQNKMQVGEYTHTTDGYMVRKVQDEGTQRERFVFVHREVWEQHHGPIPEGKMVSFLDGNKDNCEIENLVLLDNDENLEMNRKKLRFDNADSTRTGVQIARIGVAINKRKRGGKKKDHTED